MSVAVVADGVAGLLDGAGHRRKAFDVSAALEERRRDPIAGQDVEDFSRAFTGTVIEGSATARRSRDPRQTEGPKTVAERPRTDHARKAAEAQTAAVANPLWVSWSMETPL